MMLQFASGVVEDCFSHYFSRWVEPFESDDTIAVGIFEKVILRVLGIHAEGVVVGLEEFVDHAFDQLKIEHHFVVVEAVSFEDEFYFTRVTVWEAALVWVLGEKVAVLDLDHFTNSVRHV